mmetsp:Transcript_47839/g.114756  ORF Transcript_47839/g.114756 Transcript_47839/m.114756 type:complete len:230 (+) Transcript_47839:74-763(+)
MICITFMFFNTWMTQICDLPKQRNTLLSMATPARRYIASMIAFAVILLFGTMFSDPVSLLLGSPVNEPFVQADYIACTLFTSMVFKFIMLPCCVQLFASDGCARRFVLCQLPVLAFQLFSITMCQWSNRAYTMPWRIFRNSLLVPGFLLLWGILAVWAEASELEQQRMEREQSLRDAKPRTRASEAAMASMQPMMEPSPARADAPFMEQPPRKHAVASPENEAAKQHIF